MCSVFWVVFSAPVSGKLVLGKAGGLVWLCFWLGSHNYVYKTTTSGLPTPYIIGHSGFLWKIPIYCVCVCSYCKASVSNSSWCSDGSLLPFISCYWIIAEVIIQSCLSLYGFKFLCTSVAPASPKDFPASKRCLWEQLIVQILVSHKLLLYTCFFWLVTV